MSLWERVWEGVADGFMVTRPLLWIIVPLAVVLALSNPSSAVEVGRTFLGIALVLVVGGVFGGAIWGVLKGKGRGIIFCILAGPPILLPGVLTYGLIFDSWTSWREFAFVGGVTSTIAGVFFGIVAWKAVGSGQKE